jgi:PadR family transcriptional regulator PadR
MRMTIQTLRVLSAMLEDPTGSHYGFDLAKQAGIKPGVLYPILRRLENAEWATSAWEEQTPEDVGRPRRRYYTLTPNGTALARAAVEEHLAALHLDARQREPKGRIRRPSAGTA